MKKVFCLVLAVFLLTSSSTVFSITYSTCGRSNGISCVDSGEIRWGGSCTYYQARDYAIGKWNELGVIDICPDDWYTYEDVTISDSYIPDSGRTGQYTPWIGTSDIYVNNYYLDNFSETKRRNVFMHELGHALGLVDHYSYEDYGTNIIMYSNNQELDQLQLHDKNDYYYLWY